MQPCLRITQPWFRGTLSVSELGESPKTSPLLVLLGSQH